MMAKRAQTTEKKQKVNSLMGVRVKTHFIKKLIFSFHHKRTRSPLITESFIDNPSTDSDSQSEILNLNRAQNKKSQIAAQSAKNDMSAELNPTICDGQEQDQEQTMRGGLGQFSNDNDDELPTTHGDIEEQWTKRRKRFDKTIANEMGVDDLYEHAVLQEIEEGDSVMLEFGAEDNKDNDDGGNEGGFDGVELGSANDAHDDDNTDGVTDVELGNANNTTERARKTIKQKEALQ